MADYPKTTSTKRSASVKIMLHPDMAEKLRVLAEELGQAPSTLASIAVSTYVMQQTRAHRATENAVDALMTSMGPEVVEALKTLSGGRK